MLVFNEWQLAALPEQAKAHIETIHFFRDFRRRFHEQDREYHRKARDCSNSLMGDAYETSFRQDSRDGL